MGNQGLGVGFVVINSLTVSCIKFFDCMVRAAITAEFVEPGKMLCRDMDGNGVVTEKDGVR